MNKTKLTVYIASSVDGYIARQDGTLDWLDSVHLPDEDYGLHELLASLDAVVMGRKTYEIIAGMEDWFYKGKRVIVLSSQLQTVRAEAELSNEDPTTIAERLCREGIKHVWVDGGLTISRFLQQELIDQLIISTIPVLLGSGIPLFNPISKQLNCKLVSSKSYASGLVQNHYEML